MKTFIVMLLFVPAFVWSQQVKHAADDPGNLKEKIYSLSVKKIAPGEIILPFSSIRVVDNRFDTSKFGFVRVNQFIFTGKPLAKMVFEDGAAKELENYYNEFYQNAFTKNDISLLIVLKKFWLSGIDNGKNNETKIVRNDGLQKFLYCKWEFYLNKEGVYMPFKRTDTVLNGVQFEADEKSTGYKTNKQILKLILNGLIEVFDFNSAVMNMDKLSKKTWAEVKQYNAAFYDLPVLRDTIVTKGVFRNFTEFKNNQPSILNFSEKRMKVGAGAYQYYIEDDKGNLITDYWGYATGTELKLGKYDHMLLYRQGNTFEFMYKTNAVVRATGTYGGSYVSDSEWVAYQLDMETGKIY